MLEAAPQSAWLVVDESDDVEAVLGVLERLARDQLSHVAGTDDDRVLQVRDGAPTGRPRERARERDERDFPSAQKATSLCTSGLTSPVAHAPTKKLHAPSVTTCRTPTKSSTVEWSARSSSRSYRPCNLATTIQPGSERTKGERLVIRRQLVAGPLSVEQALGDHERRQQTEHVRGEECPADEPSSARALRAAFEQLSRTTIERVGEARSGELTLERVSLAGDAHRGPRRSSRWREKVRGRARRSLPEYRIRSGSAEYKRAFSARVPGLVGRGGASMLDGRGLAVEPGIAERMDRDEDRRNSQSPFPGPLEGSIDGVRDLTVNE